MEADSLEVTLIDEKLWTRTTCRQLSWLPLETQRDSYRIHYVCAAQVYRILDDNGFCHHTIVN